MRGPLARVVQACWRRQRVAHPPLRGRDERHRRDTQRPSTVVTGSRVPHARYRIEAEPTSDSGRDTRFSFLSLLSAPLPDRVKTLKSPTKSGALLG